MQKRILSLLWVAIFISELIWIGANHQNISTTQNLFELGMAHFFICMMFSFPLGWVFFVLAFSVAKIFLDPQGVAELVIIWMSAFIGGYIQWFYVVPKITSIVKQKLASK